MTYRLVVNSSMAVRHYGSHTEHGANCTLACGHRVYVVYSQRKFLPCDQCPDMNDRLPVEGEPVDEGLDARRRALASRTIYCVSGGWIVAAWSVLLAGPTLERWRWAAISTLVSLGALVLRDIVFRGRK